MKKSIHRIKQPNVLLKLLNSLDEKELPLFLNELDCYGNNILFNSDIRFTKFLINYMDINSKNKEGENSLFYSDYEKTKFLLENGCDLNCINNKGNTALFYSDLKTTKLLLEHGMNIDHLNHAGQTALFHSDYEKSKLLIEHGSNFHIIDNGGANVIFYSCINDDNLERTSLYTSLGVNNNVYPGKEHLIFHLSRMHKYEHIAFLIKNGINFSENKTIVDFQQSKVNLSFFETTLHFDINKLCFFLDIPPVNNDIVSEPQKILWHIDNYTFKREKQIINDHLLETEETSNFNIKKRI